MGLFSREPKFETLRAIVDGRVIKYADECDAEAADEINHSSNLFPTNPNSIQHFGPIMFRNLQCRSEAITNSWGSTLAEFRVKQPSGKLARQIGQHFEQQLIDLINSHRRNCDNFTIPQFGVRWPDEVVLNQVNHIDKPTRGRMASLLHGGVNPYAIDTRVKVPEGRQRFTNPVALIILTALLGFGVYVVQKTRVDRSEDDRRARLEFVHSDLLPQLTRTLVAFDSLDSLLKQNDSTHTNPALVYLLDTSREIRTKSSVYRFQLTRFFGSEAADSVYSALTEASDIFSGIPDFFRYGSGSEESGVELFVRQDSIGAWIYELQYRFEKSR